MATTIKTGDKLYVITRRDIKPGYQGVQSQHAAIQFMVDHPGRAKDWFSASNFLAWLSVVDEVELMRLIIMAKDRQVKWSAFREPDVGGQITAIALEPGDATIEMCKNLPLALREVM